MTKGTRLHQMDLMQDQDCNWKYKFSLTYKLQHTTNQMWSLWFASPLH